MSKSREIAKLVPNAVEITIQGGESVLVATTNEGNKILNYFMAAQIRDFMQRSIKRYVDGDDKPSPKDIRDLAEAGKALAEFSAKLYEGEETVLGPKTVEPAKPDVELNFGDLNKKTNGNLDSQGDSRPDNK